MPQAGRREIVFDYVDAEESHYGANGREDHEGQTVPLHLSISSSDDARDGKHARHAEDRVANEYTVQPGTECPDDASGERKSGDVEAERTQVRERRAGNRAARDDDKDGAQYAEAD